MATQIALKEIIETLKAAPPPPEIRLEGGGSVGEISAKVDAFVREHAMRFEAWRSRMLSTEVSMRSSLAEMAKGLPPDRFSEEVYPSISELIDLIGTIVAENRTQFERIVAKAKSDGELISNINPAIGAIFRNLVEPIIRLLTEHYEFRVQLYYAVLALRADYDPDAHGGPKFSDPNELREYLREQMGA